MAENPGGKYPVWLVVDVMVQRRERKREYMREYMRKRRGHGIPSLPAGKAGDSKGGLVPAYKRDVSPLVPSIPPAMLRTKAAQHLLDYLTYLNRRGLTTVRTNMGYQTVDMRTGEIRERRRKYSTAVAEAQRILKANGNGNNKPV